MKRIAVDSGAVHGIGYDLITNRLEVEFDNGDIVQYFRVPFSEYSALMKAPSQDDYFNEKIRETYNSQKIVEQQD